MCTSKYTLYPLHNMSTARNLGGHLCTRVDNEDLDHGELVGRGDRVNEFAQRDAVTGVGSRVGLGAGCAVCAVRTLANVRYR